MRKGETTPPKTDLARVPIADVPLPAALVRKLLKARIAKPR
jgi:hypothetical protein